MINNKDKIDNLFRDALEDYQVEPDNSLWRKIESRFFAYVSGFRTVILITAIAILLVGGGSLMWYLLQNPAAEQHVVSSSQSSEGSEEVSPSPTHNTELSSANLSTSAATVESIDKNEYLDDISNILPASEMSEGNLRYYKDNLTGYQRISYLGSLNFIYNTDQNHSLNDSTLTLAKPIYLSLKDDYARKATLQMGLYFTPAVIFYDQTPNNQTYSAEYSLNYERSAFSVRSGFGLGYLKDKGSYKIVYESYDSVGYYMNVTSFSIDPGNPENVTFDLERAAVYDSVPHYELTEKTNSYLYLDIPLSVGYKFYRGRRISFGVYAGAKLSFLLYKNEPTVEFSGPPSELVTIERQVPARMSTNLRLTAGLDFGYLLTDKVSLHLEPVFEQYLNSVYVNKTGFSSGKPYIIGLRAGILFNF